MKSLMQTLNPDILKHIETTLNQPTVISKMVQRARDNDDKEYIISTSYKTEGIYLYVFKRYITLGYNYKYTNLDGDIYDWKIPKTYKNVGTKLIEILSNTFLCPCCESYEYDDFTFKYNNFCNTCTMDLLSQQTFQDNCAICMEDLNKYTVFQTMCSHHFHIKCWENYKNYKKQRVKCPLCNQVQEEP